MTRLTHPEHLDELKNSLRFFGEILERDFDTEIPTCPGWTLGSLFGHLGRVHRMALAVISTGAMAPASPKELEPVPEGDNNIRTYFETSAAALVHDLEATDPSSPCWTFLGTTDEVGFWSRRMANEHAVHLFDAQRALHSDPVPTMSSLSACDAIDEYVYIANSRQLAKRADFSLNGTIHLHATDNELGEWMITEINGKLLFEAGHGKGDAAIRGTASALLLGLWGRYSLANDLRFERFGTTSLVETLASVGGN
jgi:uncharacterized protein (TIGR03083 family)